MGLTFILTIYNKNLRGGKMEKDYKELLKDERKEQVLFLLNDRELNIVGVWTLTVKALGTEYTTSININTNGELKANTKAYKPNKKAFKKLKDILLKCGFKKEDIYNYNFLYVLEIITREFISKSTGKVTRNSNILSKHYFESMIKHS